MPKIPINRENNAIHSNKLLFVLMDRIRYGGCIRSIPGLILRRGRNQYPPYTDPKISISKQSFDKISPPKPSQPPPNPHPHTRENKSPQKPAIFHIKMEAKNKKPLHFMIHHHSCLHPHNLCSNSISTRLHPRSPSYHLDNHPPEAL